MDDLVSTYRCMKGFIKNEEFLSYIRAEKLRKYNNFFLNVIKTLGLDPKEIFITLNRNSSKIKKFLRNLAYAYEVYYRTGSEIVRKIMIKTLIKIISIKYE